MDFANRGNRPVQQQSTQQANNEAPSTMPTQSQFSSPKKTKKKLDLTKLGASLLLFCIAILLVAALVGVVFGSKDENTGNLESTQIQNDRYQAVFLDSQDGQVYFGKLAIYNNEIYALTDIYYVRVENPIQPEGANQAQQPNISLAKLGNELHGPEDVMFIRRDKVLYWENLKDDGQVVKAITEFKANGGSEAQNTQEQNTQSNTPAQQNTNTNNGTGTQQTQNP
jgi:hypothetical protein